MCAQVRIMKDWDPSGKQGPRAPMPDVVTVHQPKDEDTFQEKGFIGKDKEGYAKDSFGGAAEPTQAPPQQQLPPIQQPLA